VLRHRRLSAPHFLEPDPGSTEERDLAKTAGLMRAAEEAIQSAEALSRFMMADLHWDDVKWMRDIWKGPLYVKGVMDADDAAKCVDEIGAQGVVVSNHGGRQLDRTLSSVAALPAIVDKIGDRGEVYLDGGVRRGTDVITALCLGARGVFIGRPYLYGLGAAGQRGVAAILEIFRSEIERAMVLMGCPSVAELNRSWLVRPDGSPY
jgi:L-lactate dehydrogenase (cytochrome)/(S)-mandelate dehydrogenase